MSNDYSSDPPVASAGSLILLSDKMTDMCQKIDKLGDIPQKLERLDMTITQPRKDYQQTRADLLQTQPNILKYAQVCLRKQSNDEQSKN